MRKVYKMDNVDCANCAAKMETAINKIPGVESATLSFMTQKLTISVNDDADLDAIMKQARKCVQKVDADADIIL